MQAGCCSASGLLEIVSLIAVVKCDKRAKSMRGVNWDTGASRYCGLSFSVSNFCVTKD